MARQKVNPRQFAVKDVENGKHKGKKATGNF
jgi:hypothetical protein